MKRWVLAIVLLWVAINLIAPHFDDYCVLGQLSAAQAVTINDMEWKAGGRTAAQPGDRVLNRECSEFSRRIFRVLL